jgi:hypothetical protein
MLYLEEADCELSFQRLYFSQPRKQDIQTWTVYQIGYDPAIELHTKALVWIWILIGFDRLDPDPGWHK